MIPESLVNYAIFPRYPSLGPSGVTTACLLPRLQFTAILRRLPQCLSCKAGEDEAGRVNFLIIVPAQLLLFLYAPAPERLAHIPIFGFTADHESDLAASVSRDSSVGILNGRKDFFAGFLEVGNKGQMQPLILR